MSNWQMSTPADLALAFDGEQRSLAIHNTASERAIVRKYSNLVRQAPAEYVLDFGRLLLSSYSHRWQAYEIIASHKGAFTRLGVNEVESFGQGINSWWSTDAFARTLSGPAWMRGQIPEDVRHAGERLPDIPRRSDWIRLSVGPFRIHVDQAHLN
ncbi:MAG: hypothetical protein LAP21_17010, partial [Acidobacteriia bacterium]|nr:hypothetical protein [Terriglobia bacterium]